MSAIQSDSALAHRSRKKTAVIIASIIAGILLLVIGGVSYAQAHQDVHNAGVSKQEKLIEDKNNIGIALSNCTKKSSTGTEVAIMQSQSVQQIMTSALAARYQSSAGSTPNPNTQALPNNGSLISALQESNPNVDVSTWKALLVIVESCNDDTTDAQKLLQGDAADFAAWTRQGNIFSSGWHGEFPDDDLYFVDARGVRHVGREALETMRNIVVLSSARDANGSGNDQQQDLPGFSVSSAATASH